MRPRVFIYIHYLEIGGAERALVGLLHALKPEVAEVDLFVNQHTGELMSLIPPYVHLLPQLPEYSAIERPIADIVKEGHLSVAIRRLVAKARHRKYHRTLPSDIARIDDSIYQYVFRAVSPALRDLSYLGEYDLAISFLHPHNIVAEKVKARKKICWIHTDYSTIHVNHKLELPVWQAFDEVISISGQVTESFVKVFPELAPKIRVIENIISPSLVRSLAEEEDVSEEMPRIPDYVNILSIGRYSLPKRFEEVPRMCRIMLDKGLEFKWYIIGFGPDADIRRRIEEYNVGNTLILLGKRSNPYPYILRADVYAQPSLYEGKSVTVREAQILGRPVVISDFPTAKGHLTDGVDGRIVPLPVDDCAAGIFDFVTDVHLREKISAYLSSHDYGNDAEALKLFE